MQEIHALTQSRSCNFLKRNTKYLQARFIQRNVQQKARMIKSTQRLTPAKDDNSNHNFPKLQKGSGASWFTSWSCGLLRMCSTFSLTGLTPDFKCDCYYELIHLSCTLSRPARVLSLRYNWYNLHKRQRMWNKRTKWTLGSFFFCIRLIKLKSKELCVQAVALKTSLICHVQNRHHIVNALKCFCRAGQGHN